MMVLALIEAHPHTLVRAQHSGRSHARGASAGASVFNLASCTLLPVRLHPRRPWAEGETHETRAKDRKLLACILVSLEEKQKTTIHPPPLLNPLLAFSVSVFRSTVMPNP